MFCGVALEEGLLPLAFLAENLTEYGFDLSGQDLYRVVLVFGIDSVK